MATLHSLEEISPSDAEEELQVFTDLGILDQDDQDIDFANHTPQAQGEESLSVPVTSYLNEDEELEKQRRSPSPVPTEPEDPDPEWIFYQLELHSIKVRDYAFPIPIPSLKSSQPLTELKTKTKIKPENGYYQPSSPICFPKSPHFFSSQQHETQTQTQVQENQPSIYIHPLLLPSSYPSSLPSQSLSLTLPPETFDPFKALGEFEYRLSQAPRKFFISGKSIRRLINIGWLTETEVYERCDENDLKELKEYDERCFIRIAMLKKIWGESGLGLCLIGDDVDVEEKVDEEKKVYEDVDTDMDTDCDTDVEEVESQIIPNTSRPQFQPQKYKYGYRPDGQYPYVTLPHPRTRPTRSQTETLRLGMRLYCNTVDKVMRMARAEEEYRERDRKEGIFAAEVKRRVEERYKAQMELDRERRMKEREIEREREVRNWVSGTIRIPSRNNQNQNPYPNAYPKPIVNPNVNPNSRRATSPDTRKRSPFDAWGPDPENSISLTTRNIAKLDVSVKDDDDYYTEDKKENKRVRMVNVPRRLPSFSSAPASTSAAIPLSASSSMSMTGITPTPSSAYIPPSTPTSRTPTQSPNTTPKSHKHVRYQSQPSNQSPNYISGYNRRSPIPSTSNEREGQHRRSNSQPYPYHQQHVYPRPGTTINGNGNNNGSRTPTDDGSENINKEGEGKEGEGEDKEDNRPNALKRPPKRPPGGLTRTRTMLQIC